MTVQLTKSIDVVCPNCDQIVMVPVVVGCMLVRGKSLYLTELSAKAPHTCRQGEAVPIDEPAEQPRIGDGVQ